MNILVVVFLVTALVGLLAAGVSSRLGQGQPGVTEPQSRPILGGSLPDTHAWQRFHVRYYTMTLLFVAFEMEMMFMYPWAVVFVEEGVKALAEMGMFLVILSVGILYGWREGIFQWE